MPVITIEYDENDVTKHEMLVLSEAIQKIVSETTGVEDVLVYTNTSQIVIHIHPIEIFVRINEKLVPDLDKLTDDFTESIRGWKRGTGFKVPINLTVIPMHWKTEIGI